MHLLPACPEDLEAYLEMDLDLEDDHITHCFCQFAANHGLYKAVERGRMVGVMMLEHLTDEHAYLGAARVDRRYRKSGVATALCEHLIALARERGYRWIGLSTEAENVPARRTAARLGFELVGRHLSCHNHRRLRKQKGENASWSMASEEKAGLLADAYSQTRLLPRTPYALVPWPERGLPSEYLDQLTFHRLPSPDGPIMYAVNRAAHPEDLHMMALHPAPHYSRGLLATLLEQQEGPYESAHIDFPVCSSHDMSALVALPEPWEVLRWVVYGQTL